MRLITPVTFLFLFLLRPLTMFLRYSWRWGGRWAILHLYRSSCILRRFLERSPFAFFLRPRSFVILGLALLITMSGTRVMSAQGPREALAENTELLIEERGPAVVTSTEDTFASLSLQTLTPPFGGEADDELLVRSILEGSVIVEPLIPTSATWGEGLRDSIETYTVTDGDTLSSIAVKFGISIETILWENKLTLRSIIRPGDLLAILPVSGLSHEVARGETVSAIAKRYNVAEEEILNFNEINDPATVMLGKKLIIPEGKMPLPTPRVVQRAPRPAQPSSIRHSTQEGTTPLLWPTPSRRINQGFTWRHSGIDIDGDYTSPIYASEDGVVVFSGWAQGYGLSIVIDHGNGIQTRYAHASKLLTSVGENVERGQTVARVGSTGRSTGTHLHFEVMRNGRRVSPWPYLR